MKDGWYIQSPGDLNRIILVESFQEAMDKWFKVSGGQVYVLGMALKGKNKGKLTTREERVFICKKCPHTLKTFDVTVNIPHVSGWMNMTPDEAMITGKQFFGQGFWNNFVTE